MRKVPETPALSGSRNEQRLVLVTLDELDARIEAAVTRALTSISSATDTMVDAKTAQTFGIGRRTFYRLIHEGLVRGHRVGRALVVARSELVAWVEAQPAVAPTPEPREADPVAEALKAGRLRVVGGKR